MVGADKAAGHIAVMRDSIPDLGLYAFLKQAGIVESKVFRLTSGRNSRVWRVESANGPCIVKEYYRDPGDPRDRLKTEFGFLSFLHSHGITCVPRPLVIQQEAGRALYSHLSGTAVDQISDDHIRQAADFILQVNRFRESESASRLPMASDACFSIREHLQRANDRLNRIESAVVNADTPVVSEAHDFVAGCLRPAMAQLEKRLIKQFSGSRMDFILPELERILSPSDFGFHNMLVSDNGRLSFLDFEYAGWDDPAKLICDFSCQPERPVSRIQSSKFSIRFVDNCFGNDCLARATALILVCRIKWCCILLNEFRAQDIERRKHAGHDRPDLLVTQLNKARNYFNQHLGDM
ncbi:MAG: aminoglycoside phosphotransferase family protein [Desulfatirhabdiaceae bacterium]